MTTSILDNRPFVAFLSGNAVSLVGLWVQRVALGWLAWELTESEFWVGVIAFTDFFPLAVLGPIFGVLADRHDRRKSALFVNSLMLCNAAALAVVTGWFNPSIEVICLLAGVNGCTAAAYTPVRLALVPNLVERQHLRAAVALGSVTFNVARFIGPAVGGVIIALAGVPWAFAFNAVTYLAILAALYVIRLRPNASAPEARESLRKELATGARYTRDHPILPGLIMLAFTSATCARAMLELMPAFAGGVFDRGSSGLAILTSSAGAGAIFAGLLLSRDWAPDKLYRLAAGTAFGSGLVLVFLGYTHSFVLGVVAVSLLGFCAAATGVGSQALVQTYVDDQYRGRATSIWAMFTFGGPALGSAAAGWLALDFGLQTVAIGAGILCSLLIAVLFLRTRQRVDGLSREAG